jgi:hypothetical protein
VASRQAKARLVRARAALMERGTSALDDVRALIIRLSPSPICDGCVAEKLGLPIPQYANQKTRLLAGSPRFERRRDICSICYAERLVIRAR